MKKKIGEARFTISVDYFNDDTFSIEMKSVAGGELNENAKKVCFYLKDKLTKMYNDFDKAMKTVNCLGVEFETAVNLVETEIPDLEIIDEF